MDEANLLQEPHRRWNPLTNEWVLVSPHRTQRPWQGQTEANASAPVEYDPSCYLCPGNARAGGHRNPKYDNTFVFDNDFAALKMTGIPFKRDRSGKGFLVAEAEQGICRVVCFSPRHDLTLPQMSSEDIRRVVEMWADEYESLGRMPEINHVQIFENRGAVMGCSNPHPHGQIWANATIPNEPRKETTSLIRYQESNGSCLLCDYVKLEQQLSERVVCENDGFVVVVPFWATWPFETLLLSKRHCESLSGMSPDERGNLADILRQTTIRYDNLFETSFPYSMGFHQQPTDGVRHPEWHFHGHFYPPLLRSATIRKFMVGYEMLAMPQRDITPEQAAQRLRELPEEHYLQRRG